MHLPYAYICSASVDTGSNLYHAALDKVNSSRNVKMVNLILLVAKVTRLLFEAASKTSVYTHTYTCMCVSICIYTVYDATRRKWEDG